MVLLVFTSVIGGVHVSIISVHLVFTKLYGVHSFYLGFSFSSPLQALIHGVLDLMNFGCFVLSRCKHSHFNAMGNSIKACTKFNKSSKPQDCVKIPPFQCEKNSPKKHAMFVYMYIQFTSDTV